MPELVIETVKAQDLRNDDVLVRGEDPGEPYGYVVGKPEWKTKYVHVRIAAAAGSDRTPRNERFLVDQEFSVRRTRATKQEMAAVFADRLAETVKAERDAEAGVVAEFALAAEKSGLLYAVRNSTEGMAKAGREAQRAAEIGYVQENRPELALFEAVLLVGEKIKQNLIQSGADDRWSGRVRNEIERVVADSDRTWISGGMGSSYGYAEYVRNLLSGEEFAIR